MNKDLYWYWLCNIQGIGLKKTREIIEFFGSPEAAWNGNTEEYAYLNYIKPNDIQRIFDSKNKESIIKSYNKLLERNISFISIENNLYPEKLKNIYDHPFGIYVNGKLPSEEQPTVAIIGARNCTNYGKEMARYFAKELSKGGIQIISGLARGIDTHAHMGAIDAGVATYAVLGNGVNICYPPENLSVMMEIEKTGGIISEYNIDVCAKPGHFPMRNRLISALSDAVFVIEAKNKSGSLITVDIALEHGKDIFALPGRLFDPLSEGTNNLIKMGAKLITEPEDIFEELGISTQNNSGIDNKNIKKNLNLLDIEEKIVYACLSLEPKYIDDVISETNLNIQQVMHLLLNLELKGYIKQINGNYYVICV